MESDDCDAGDRAGAGAIEQAAASQHQHCDFLRFSGCRQRLRWGRGYAQIAGGNNGRRALDPVRRGPGVAAEEAR